MANEKTVDVIGKLIDHFKSPKYLLVISIISGILLFGTFDIVNKLGLISFVEKYRIWIGIIFLITTGFWLVDIILLIIKEAKSKYTGFHNSKAMEERLKQLTIEEKVILGKYINRETRVQTLDYANGTVCELEGYHIIYQASNISRHHTFFDYNIQPWAWEYLNKHKDLLYTPIEQVL